jgi:hypothetical protein
VVNAALMKLRSYRRKAEESIEELLPQFNEQGEWGSQVAPWEASSDTLLQLLTMHPEDEAEVVLPAEHAQEHVV